MKIENTFSSHLEFKEKKLVKVHEKLVFHLKEAMFLGKMVSFTFVKIVT